MSYSKNPNNNNNSCDIPDLEEVPAAIVIPRDNQIHVPSVYLDFLLDIFKIVVKFTASPIDGSGPLSQLFEFAISCKDWARRFLPYLRQIALHKKRVVEISSLLYQSSIGMFDFTYIYEGENFNKNENANYTMKMIDDGILEIYAPDFAKGTTDARNCPFLGGGNCTLGKTKEDWAAHYPCWFELLVTIQRSGLYKIKSRWTYEGCPHAVGGYNVTYDTMKKIMTQGINEVTIVRDTALRNVSFLAGANLIGKKYIEAECLITPVSIINWIRSIWNEEGAMPALLVNLRAELALGVVGSKVKGFYII